jgi:hypothetical protein
MDILLSKAAASSRRSGDYRGFREEWGCSGAEPSHRQRSWFVAKLAPEASSVRSYGATGEEQASLPQ